MADKDEFKFDDDDTFPETDLSNAFSEGEQTAPGEPEYPMTIKKSGGSKTRLLLGLLLLVVAGGAAYYFLMMEEPAPPPTPPAKKVVAAPKPAPKPAPAPASAAPAQPAAPAGGVAQVSVPPPPPVNPAPPPASTPVAVTPPPKPAAPAPAAAPVPAKPAPVVASTPAKPAVAAAVTPPPKPAPATTQAPAEKPAAAKAAVPAVTGGPWLVEAGTYLNASALNAAQKKIRALGYEPQVTSTQKIVRMTRLRLGTFPESEVKEALAYARGVAPDAFAIRAGESFTVYAGTYTNPQNIRQMTERLVSEGVPVAEEPLELKRTISLVRFGGFGDQATAAEVAAKARKAGIAAEAVNPR